MTTAQMDRLDQEFSKYIRARDGRCMYQKVCHGKFFTFKQLTNSHYHGRGHWNVRFDPENCDAACILCHKFIEKPQNSSWFYGWKLRQLGIDRLQALDARRNDFWKKPYPVALQDIKDLLATLNESQRDFIKGITWGN